MEFNNGKKVAQEVWAVVDNEGMVAYTTGSNKINPRMMTYPSESYATRNMRHAPKVEGKSYSVIKIYPGG